jgi:HPt (histidine-containing phosphotransfer) domain-containing protein
MAPVIDHRELTQLGEQLGDDRAMRQFVERYTAMLDHRVERLQHALDAQDAADWEDAALSLRTSSAMAGADALSRMVAASEAWVKEWWSGDARPCSSARQCVMLSLRLLADETDRQLRDFLAPERSGASGRYAG